MEVEDQKDEGIFRKPVSDHAIALRVRELQQRWAVPTYLKNDQTLSRPLLAMA